MRAADGMQRKMPVFLRSYAAGLRSKEGGGGRIPSGERPVLIFQHLPKTGGISLAEFLKSKYERENYYEIDRDPTLAPGISLNQFIALPRANRDRFDLILGHFPYGLHKFLSRPCVYVTLLRNPLERCLSFYHQLLRDHPRSHKFMARNYTVEEYIQDLNTLGSGTAPAVKIFSDMVLDGLFGRQGYKCKVEWGYALHPQDTQVIKRRLSDEFMLVGLTERLDDFLFLLCRRMGWRPSALGHENKTPGRPPAEQELSPDQLGRANEKLSAEWELYSHAEKLFQEQWKDLGIKGRIHASCRRYAKKNASLS